MNLQYISDEQGRHTAVIVPIEEWNEIKANQQHLKTLEKPKVKPSDFFGTLSKETAQKMISEIELSRSEWER